MIEYYSVDGVNALRKVYYFQFGDLAFKHIMGTAPQEDDFSPFNDTIYSAVIGAPTDYYGIFISHFANFPAIRKWPLPVYDRGVVETANRVILYNLLGNYIFPRYWEAYILPTGSEETDEEAEACWKSFINRFLNVMMSTWGKYVPLIKIYQEKEEELTSQVKSSSGTLSRFNDTPQESGDFSDEEHTTTATQSDTISLTDYDTPINRIRDIREKWENLFDAWARDFDILFSKEEADR